MICAGVADHSDGSPNHQSFVTLAVLRTLREPEVLQHSGPTLELTHDTGAAMSPYLVLMNGRLRTNPFMINATRTGERGQKKPWPVFF